MKLLFDQNLSFRLCQLLDDIFPQSTQTGLVGLARADDLTVWNYAGAEGLTLVSLDSDFADLAALRGPPPKVIWLRFGNLPTDAVAGILRRRAGAILCRILDPAVSRASHLR